MATCGSKPFPPCRRPDIEENGYEIAGEIRESYLDGVWNKDEESEWLSEIQVPIRKKTE